MIVLLIWLLAVIVGVMVGQGKNRTGLAVLLTVLLGWIGVLVVVLLPPAPPKALGK